MNGETTFAQTLFSPAVLLTILVLLLLGAAAIWIVLQRERHLRTQALAEQRRQQEATVDRLLASFGQDQEQVGQRYTTGLQEREARIAMLEKENARLRDRLTSSGIMGLFGGNKREVLSALLLENEQLHELLAQKQSQMHDLVTDLTRQLLERLDEQAQESARAVRYKQALLSAFLQHQEARQLLDRLIAEGQIEAAVPQEIEQP